MRGVYVLVVSLIISIRKEKKLGLMRIPIVLCLLVITDCILTMTSRPTLSACVNVLVATNERLTCTDNFLGTSPNGFNSFMCVLTQIKYLLMGKKKENK